MSRSPLRRWAGPAFAGSLALVASALPLVATPALAASPDLVISQVYGGGGNAGATFTNDFVELFNRSSAPVGTGGLSVQYASATGTGNFVAFALPDRTVPAGGSFLVQLAGGSTGAALPSPDASNGGPNLSGSSGKVALVEGTTGLACNGGSTPCTPAQLAQIVDLVGYGTANFAEGAAAPTLTNSTAAVRADGGCTDTDDNSADFISAVPAPRNSLTPPTPCGAPGGPATPVPSCPEVLRAETTTGATAAVSATDTDSRITSATLTTPPAGITLAGFSASPADAAPGSATLTVAPSTARGTYEVEVVFGTDDDPAQTVSCSVDITVSDTSTPTPVSQVQGPGTSTPLQGQDVLVEAVVTSLITSNDALNGFFVQEQDADADNDPATSEGVYVFCGTRCPTGLAAGDVVRVTGRADEFSGSTQVNASRAGTSIVEVGTAPLPTAAVITLPAAGSTRDADTFERFEGMRTTISTTLAVSEYFNLARFGEVVLTADERAYQFTQLNDPSVEGYQAFLADLGTRRIVLDDASNDQNDATSGPLSNEVYPYPAPGLSTENFFRGGDTITGLTGVLEYSFGAWKLRPIEGEDYTFDRTNPRPTAPDEVGGRLQVASFNVLNYFATIDRTPSNDVGLCAPSGTEDCRGADSDAERVRQLDKIVAALSTIGADVFGLIEIQNDDGTATRQIVEALNAEVGEGTYDFIDTGVLGTDAIRQAFIYDTTTVKPIGDYAVLDSSVDADFDTNRNRPSLIQTFEEIETGELVTVSVNHLKSKGSGCGAGDDSAADGSGNCDATRTRAAQALVDYLATDPTDSGDPDFLVIGDLNSYAKERPLQVLEGAGYVNLLQQFEGADSYGYLFDGLLGDLDHALASASLLPQVTGAGGWDVNADEIPLFDYNDTVRDLGERDEFERESSALPLYEPNAYRSSDHDPAIVGLALTSPNRAPVAQLSGPDTVRVGRTIELDASGSSDPNRLDTLSYAWDLDGDGAFDDATGPVVEFRGTRGPGPKSVAVQVSDGTDTAVARTTVTVTLPGRP